MHDRKLRRSQKWLRCVSSWAKCDLSQTHEDLQVGFGCGDTFQLPDGPVFMSERALIEPWEVQLYEGLCVPETNVHVNSRSKAEVLAESAESINVWREPGPVLAVADSYVKVGQEALKTSAGTFGAATGFLPRCRRL